MQYFLFVLIWMKKTINDIGTFLHEMQSDPELRRFSGNSTLFWLLLFKR